MIYIQILLQVLVLPLSPCEEVQLELSVEEAGEIQGVDKFLFSKLLSTDVLDH